MSRAQRYRDQRSAIKADLAAGKVVTQQTAAAKHGCWRLASIIERIRRVDGWPVVTTIDPRDGHALYSLPKGWTPPVPLSPGGRGAGAAGDPGEGENTPTHPALRDQLYRHAAPAGGSVPDVLNGDTLDADGQPL